MRALDVEFKVQQASDLYFADEFCRAGRRLEIRKSGSPCCIVVVVCVCVCGTPVSKDLGPDAISHKKQGGSEPSTIHCPTKTVVEVL